MLGEVSALQESLLHIKPERAQRSNNTDVIPYWTVATHVHQVILAVACGDHDRLTRMIVLSGQFGGGELVMAEAPRVINLVFDGPPAPHGPHLVEITDDQGSSTALRPGGARLVEIEDDAGRSIAIGEWIDRGDGLWALRILCQSPPSR